MATVRLHHEPFQKQLAFGRIAESRIAQWLIQRCKYSILPVYDQEYATGKGPRYFSKDEEIVAPDLLAIREDTVRWIEAKHKTVFTWYRKKQRWETGIDANHFDHYVKIAKRTPFPIYLMFLHESEVPATHDRKHCPSKCPTGLYTGEIQDLIPQARFDRRWGQHGMVYWGVDDLRKLAELDEILRYSNN